MVAEPIPDQNPPVSPPAQPSRPMSRRRKRRMLLALVVIAAVLVIVFWGWSATGREFLGVGSLVQDINSTDPPSVPAKYQGKPIEVQGIVKDWSGGTSLEFTLVDKLNESKTIEVSMHGTMPEGFDNGKTVVVKCTLDDSSPLTLQATAVTVGCASKY
jgi:cytochrome c-type biogenesis protein CcmE